MKFWNFIPSVDSMPAQLRIDGDIVADNDAWYYEWYGDTHTTPNAFRNELAQYDGQELEVVISTFGGDVFAGLGIAGDIRARNGRTIGIVHSHCMSIGMTILSAMDEVRAMSGAMFMIHSPLTSMQGGINEFEQTLERLNTVKDSIIAGYQNKVNLSYDQLSEMMLAETWMTAEQAKGHGFVDAIIEVETGDEGAVYNRMQIVNTIQKTTEQFKQFLMTRNQVNDDKQALKEKSNRLKELALIVETY